MGRYDEDNYSSQPAMRQKDLVLSTNEFVFIQSKTNGQIKTYTGPIMVTISAQESMVIFNPKTKRFEETADFSGHRFFLFHNTSNLKTQAHPLNASGRASIEHPA